MVMGFDGTTVSPRARTMLATLQPGGVILFKRNIEEAAQTHALLRDAQKIVATPLFHSVDMEGGSVDRFRDVIASIPSAAEVFAAGSPKLFRKHGSLIGTQLRAFGFNTDFAPCLDLRLDASAKVMGSRTVSADPGETVRYAREFLTGLRQARVLGCGKHFPGLGGANLDSHHGLPSIDTTLNHLWPRDLVPYRTLRTQLPFVMVAHVSYPRITRSPTPASLSKKWISDILRKKLAYRGLIISDDLDMGGVLNSVSIEDAVIETLRAGSDLFLVCQKEEHVWRAYEAVYECAATDRGFRRLLAEKVKRIASFKSKSPEVRARLSPCPTTATVAKLRRAVWEFTEELRSYSICQPETLPS